MRCPLCKVSIQCSRALFFRIWIIVRASAVIVLLWSTSIFCVCRTRAYDGVIQHSWCCLFLGEQAWRRSILSFLWVHSTWTTFRGGSVTIFVAAVSGEWHKDPDSETLACKLSTPIDGGESILPLCQAFSNLCQRALCQQWQRSKSRQKGFVHFKIPAWVWCMLFLQHSAIHLHH